MTSAPCIIPARGGSVVIPRKNITDLAGKPLIAWTLEAATAAVSVDDIFVSTEDDEIAEISKQYGAFIIERPQELAGNDTTSELVLLHALEQLEQANGVTPEFFIFIQCTSPLLAAVDIDACVEMLVRDGADSVIAVSEGSYYLWREHSDGTAQPVNHDPSIRLPRQLAGPQFRETGAVYAIRTEAFRAERTRYCGRTALMKMPESRSFEIDTPEDLRILLAIIRANLSN